MGTRHTDALCIQEGACNPSGIAHSIVRACAEIRNEPSPTGTSQITNDPAIRLMVHQLAFICGVTTGVEGFASGESYEDAMRECRIQDNFRAAELERALVK